MKKLLSNTRWVLITGFSISIAIFMLHYFLPNMPMGVPNIVNANSAIVLRLHIGGGILAAITGITQFWPKFRAKHPKTHKYSGYAYVLGIAVASPMGIIMAYNSQGGLVTHIGFGMLSVLWGYTTFMAIRFVFKKQINLHRQWMLRSFALTFAFVTLRLWIGILMVMGGEFDQVYQTVSWLCWVPNLLIIEYYILNKYYKVVSKTS